MIILRVETVNLDLGFCWMDSLVFVNWFKAEY